MIKSLLSEVLADFKKKNLPFLASAIAYNSMLMLVPFFLLLFSAIGILSSYLPLYGLDLKQFFKAVLGKYGEEAFRFSKNLAEKRFGYGSLGIIGLLITFSFVLSPVEHALKLIFEEEESKPFWVQRLLGFSIFFILVLFLSVFAILTFVVQAVATFLNHSKMKEILPEGVRGISLSGNLLTSVLFMVVVFVISLVVYKFSTEKKLSIRLASLGAAFTSLLVEVGRQLYLLYLKLFPFYDFIYGAFSFFFVSAVFIYFTSLIFLVGALLIKAAERILIRYEK